MKLYRLFDKLEELKKNRNLEQYWKTVPQKWNIIRAKDKIKVLFVIPEISTWKTEALFRCMMEHERFDPIIGLTLAIYNPPSEAIDNFREMKDYVVKKGYPFVEIYQDNIRHVVQADIIFYSKPYDLTIPPQVFYYNNKEALFCYQTYGFNTIDTKWSYDEWLHRYCAHYYVINDMVRKAAIGFAYKNRGQFLATGLPLADEALKLASDTEQPWHNEEPKKRILYAPHWTIQDGIHETFLHFSTFLENGEFILRLAKKYKTQTHWAFKPHPLLKLKLTEVWGAERTERYYRDWQNIENRQLENGAYSELFKQSDAMIHDSCSFTIEYLYTRNPVMFLADKEDTAFSEMNEMGRNAYLQHYIGRSQADIEQFVKNVINGKDPMRAQREDFFNKWLLPPNGKSACDNIINAILGE